MRKTVLKKLLPFCLVAASLLMFSSTKSYAQNSHRHINIDSIIHAHIDSILAHHHHDTIPTPPPPHHPDSLQIHHIDSIIHAHIDSIIAHHHQDTVPPPYHHSRLDSLRIHHIDSIIHARIDSIIAHHHHDSIPPHHSCFDSLQIHHIDSIIHAHIDSVIAHRNHNRYEDSLLIHRIDSINQALIDSFLAHHPWLDSIPHWGRVETIGSNSAATANVLVYPNPIVSTSVLHIENAANSTLVFRMYESTGRLVNVKENLGNGDYSISNGQLAAGLYIYEVYNGNQRVTSGKLLVQ